MRNRLLEYYYCDIWWWWSDKHWKVDPMTTFYFPYRCKIMYLKLIRGNLIKHLLFCFFCSSLLSRHPTMYGGVKSWKLFFTPQVFKTMCNSFHNPIYTHPATHPLPWVTITYHHAHGTHVSQSCPHNIKHPCLSWWP